MKHRPIPGTSGMDVVLNGERYYVRFDYAVTHHDAEYEMGSVCIHASDTVEAEIKHAAKYNYDANQPALIEVDRNNLLLKSELNPIVVEAFEKHVKEGGLDEE